MKRTDLREQFFAEARTEPFAAMLEHLYGDAWAQGYEQALSDHGLTDARLAKSFAERRIDAIEYLTDESRKREALNLIAIAETGKRTSRR